MDDCVFCKIVKKEIPSSIVFEDENVIIFKNNQPVATVHLLICPKKHIESFMKLDDDTTLNLMYKAIQNIILEYKIEDGFKLVFNGGRYQTVPHLHWHLLSGDLEKNEDVMNKL